MLSSPPVITTNPTSQILVLTSNINFSVSATGSPPLAYQWQLNGTAIAGATNSGIAIVGADFTNAGNYRVVITNGSGSVTSSVAVLSLFVPPQIGWQADFGGTDDDALIAAVPTSDGGFLLGGYSSSGISGNKTNALVSTAPDWWVVKTDGSGVKQWERTFGGNNIDSLNAVAQMTNGDYLLAGYSMSPISGNKTVGTYGDRDYWLMRINTNGTTLWQTNYGGSNAEYLLTMAPTSDGGCILGGHSISTVSGNKTSTLYGVYDYWLVKVDGNGVKQWEKTYGGPDYDLLADHGVQQTADGGYLVVGSSQSVASGNKTSVNYGNYDYWVLKLDGSGNKIWENNFGGSGDDRPTVIRQTSDGGCIVGGYTDSGNTGNKTTANLGGQDAWIVKLDTLGIKQWEREYGGTVNDLLADLQQTSDGGYLVVATTASSATGNMTSTNHGLNDLWLFKLDSNGDKIWETTYGGTSNDEVPVVMALTNGSFFIGGRSESPGTGNKTVTGYGLRDYWVLKLGSLPVFINTPSSQFAELCSSVTLNGRAGSDSLLTYQWRLAGTNLPGATASSYSFTASLAKAGDYTVVVSNGFGSITSAVATVTIADTLFPTVSAAPGNQTNTANASCQYVLPDFRGSVVASDCSGVTIAQTPAPGSVLGLGNTLVTLTTTDGFSHVVTNTLTITVRDITPPTFSVVPHDVTVVAGQATSLNANATDCSPVSYQWFRNGSSLDGANAGTYSIPVASATNGGYYTVVATSGGGSVTSSIVLVTVAALPSSTPLGSKILFGNGGTVLSVSAYGAPPLSYQWTLNGTNISGANDSSYTIPGSALNAGSYNVVVSNPYGSYTNTPINALFFGDLKMYAGTTIGGTVGAAYRVDYADVINGVTNAWQVLTNLILPSTPFIVIDPNSPDHNQRFYRLVTP